MTLQITINQSGKSAGVAGQAREDLDNVPVGPQGSVLVTLTATGGTGTYAWLLLDAPPNEAMTAPSASTLSASSGSSVTITPDNADTYLVQCSSGTETVQITFYAGPTLSAAADELPQRIPSFDEGNVHNAPDLVYPTGNIKGWAQVLRRWLSVIRRHDAILSGDNGHPSADLALTTNSATPFTGVVITGLPALAASKIYGVVIGITVFQYIDSTGDNGSIDIVVGLKVTTNSSSDPSYVLTQASDANVDMLPAELSGATAELTASAGALVLTATRKAGANSHARYTIKVRKFEPTGVNAPS